MHCLCTDCPTYSDTHIHTYTYIHLLIIVSGVCLFFLIVVSLLFYWRATNLVLLMEKVQHLFLFPSPPSKYMHMSYSLITCVSFLPLVQSLPVQLFSSLPIDGKKDPLYSIQSECESLQPGEKVRLHAHIQIVSQTDKHGQTDRQVDTVFCLPCSTRQLFM